MAVDFTTVAESFPACGSVMAATMQQTGHGSHAPVAHMAGAFAAALHAIQGPHSHTRGHVVAAGYHVAFDSDPSGGDYSLHVCDNPGDMP